MKVLILQWCTYFVFLDEYHIILKMRVILDIKSDLVCTLDRSNPALIFNIKKNKQII